MTTQNLFSKITEMQFYSAYFAIDDPKVDKYGEFSVLLCGNY